jgi:hypothetical protein
MSHTSAVSICLFFESIISVAQQGCFSSRAIKSQDSGSYMIKEYYTLNDNQSKLPGLQPIMFSNFSLSTNSKVACIESQFYSFAFCLGEHHRYIVECDLLQNTQRTMLTTGGGRGVPT